MISALIEQTKKTAPVVVGLDPILDFIPAHIIEKAYDEYGESLAAAGEALWQFNKEIIDHVHDLIPAVKPQIAMYESFGIEGLKAFAKTCAYSKEKGLLVIGDVKRGDIGSSAFAYAIGHLGKVQIGTNCISAFQEDFITVNPYLGSDGVKPFIEVAKEEGKGIFVLVKTSNPGSGEFQDQILNTTNESKTPLYELVAQKVAEWGAEAGEDDENSYGYNPVGAVVAATYPEQARRLRKIMPQTYFLVPGYGVQGGKAADLTHFFNADGLGAIVNSSRGIIAAHQSERYQEFGNALFATAARTAVEDMIKDIKGVL
ncbi:MAG: orotidine-5'-phosphate decarboxylase [Lachnospiraceae bacterium]|nr:orotidine-5'-phosphate decarboxylase [Lachnospiraceae bacterium]